MVVYRYINAYPATGLADPPVATRYGTFSRLLVCSLVLLVALNSNAGNRRTETRISKEPLMNVTEKAVAGTSESPFGGGTNESTPKHFTQNLSNSQESLNDASMPPPNDSVRVPDRRIPRPQWETLGDISGNGVLFAGNNYLLLLPRHRSVSELFIAIDGNFHSKSIAFPGNSRQSYYPLTMLGRDKSALLSTKKCVLKISREQRQLSAKLGFPLPSTSKYISIYGLDEQGNLEEVLAVDVRKLAGQHFESQKAIGARLRFSQCGTGYAGLLELAIRKEKSRDNEKKNWIYRQLFLRYDEDFQLLDSKLCKNNSRANALNCGGGKRTVATIVNPNSFYFVAKEGEQYSRSIGEHLGEMPSRPPLDWERPGIVEGSEYFAVARNDRATLPVFDLSVWPPELVHSYRVGTLVPAGMTSLIAGKWLYAKEGASTTIRGINLQNKDMKRKKFLFTESLEDGWKKTIPGTDLWFAFGAFGYWKGNIIVPARTNIYFLDEKTGEINYRFCLLEYSGNSLLPEQRWYDHVWPEWERERYMDENSRYFRVTSFELFNGHLFAITNKPETPIYVWKLPTSPE